MPPDMGALKRQHPFCGLPAKVHSLNITMRKQKTAPNGESCAEHAHKLQDATWGKTEELLKETKSVEWIALSYQCDVP